MKENESLELDYTTSTNAEISSLTGIQIFSTTIPNLISSQNPNNQEAGEDIVNGNLLLGNPEII